MQEQIDVPCQGTAPNKAEAERRSAVSATEVGVLSRVPTPAVDDRRSVLIAAPLFLGPARRDEAAVGRWR